MKASMRSSNNYQKSRIGYSILIFVSLLFFLLKMVIDLPLMYSFNRFQQSLSLLWFFPFMELMNAVYTLIIGMAGNIGKYEWKGRKISTYAHNAGSDFHK